MDVEAFIRDNVPWAKLPDDIQIILGKSQREYDKLILEYSIKNQLRYKGNLVRHVKKNEETYYDIVIKYSESHVMLFPYHLSDIVVRELRITPFNYYINIIMEMINSEKSYDSLPNFTAADAMRLLGIGRNQYIDLMNQNRSNRKLFRRNRPLRELLPARPARVPIEPWWIVCAGSILEADVRHLNAAERLLVDQLLDEGPQMAGNMDLNQVHQMFHTGLVYFDVPVSDNDYVYVAPLDGFVMNRVLGDYFETLLYKIFVAIDDQTTVKEIAEMLHIDLHLVKNAISVFCRLGFAKKRVTGVEGAKLHPSWASHTPAMSASSTQEDLMAASLSDLGELSASLTSPVGDDEDDDVAPSALSPGNNVLPNQTPLSSSDTVASSGRAAMLFDSTLTAFLMMGNLSTSLKGHAVTLFEVGKLADEQLKDFMDQLDNVNRFAEGEAARYSAHAVALLDSLRSLRVGREVDMLRGESLLSLDTQSRTRILHKAYSLIVAVAPLCADACTLPVSTLPFLGPPIPEVCCPWLRLALYEMTGSGPASVFFPRGERVTRMPTILASASYYLVSSINHEPQVVSANTALTLVNDLLLTTPLFVQAYDSKASEEDLIYVPFPFEEKELVEPDSMACHPAVSILREKLSLGKLCGYLTLVRDSVEKKECANGERDDLPTGSPKKEPTLISHLPPSTAFSSFTLLDCVFGVPLFSSQLNALICKRIREQGIMLEENRTNIQFANKNLIDVTMELIGKYNCGVVHMTTRDTEPRRVEVIPPVRTIFYDPTTKKVGAIDDLSLF